MQKLNRGPLAALLIALPLMAGAAPQKSAFAEAPCSLTGAIAAPADAMGGEQDCGFWIACVFMMTAPLVVGFLSDESKRTHPLL